MLYLLMTFVKILGILLLFLDNLLKGYFMKTSFTIKSFALVFGGVLTLTACGEKAPATQETAPTASTQSATNSSATAPADNNTQSASNTTNLPTYRVAIDPYYPPFEYLDENGKIVGFDVDLLDAIAQKEGFKPDYQANQILNIVSSVQEGKDDIGASSIFILPERKEVIDYSDSYFELPLAVMGLEKEGRPQSIDEITGKTIAVQTEIIMETIVDGEFVPKGNTKHGVKSNFLAFQNVLQGNSDLMLDNVVTIQGFLLKAQDKPTYVLPLPADKNLQLGYVVKKGNTELQEKLNSGLKKVKEDGTYDKIYDKWFGKDSAYPIVNMNINTTK